MSAIAHQQEAPRECWSKDNETFNCDSLSELLDEMDANCIEPGNGIKAGMVVYVGDAVKPKLSELVDADMVIDGIADRAYDVAGEYADDYPDYSPEQKAELQALLEGWLSRTGEIRFYNVHNAREYILTEEDVAPYKEAA